MSGQQRSHRFYYIIPLTLILLLVHASLATQASNSGGTHYIVIEQAADGTITPVFQQIVAADPPPGLDASTAHTRWNDANRQANAIGVTLFNSSNQPIYHSVVEMNAWTRGDFHDSNGHLYPLHTQYAVVRVPAHTGSHITLNVNAPNNNQRGVQTRIDLNTLAAPDARSINSNAQVQRSGDDDDTNRVNILVIGDGYTSAQQSQFNADADRLISGFFTITPYAEYKPYFSVTKLFLPSAQSGADHPPYDPNYTGGDRQPTRCVDPAAANDPLAGQFVETALNASYCGNGLHRLLLVDIPLTLAAAAAAPEWDQIMVIVNDGTYGGSGGAFAVLASRSDMTQIAQHEFGHTFTRLADTYESPYPGYPACSDVNSSTTDDCEPNVTNQTNRNALKWAGWLSPGVNTPTAEGNPPAAPHIVGLYEGARFQSSGMYRASDTSLMRELGKPFSPVENAAFVNRIYNGWSGHSGISTIDAVSPETSTTINIGQSLTVSADLLHPIGGPGLGVRWSVNGEIISENVGHTSTAYTLTPETPGRYTITLETADLTPFVLHDDRVIHQHTWDVYVGSATNDAPTAGVYFKESDTLINEGETVLHVEVDLFVQAGPDGEPYPSPLDVTLDLSGTALNAEDFTIPPTVTFVQQGGFGTGVYTQLVPIIIHDDPQPEDTETLTLSLSGAAAQVAVYDFAAHTITINMSDVSLEPVNLSIDNAALTEDTPPTPAYHWTHQAQPADTEVPASWYQLVIQKDGITLIDRWYHADDICTGVQCTVQHPAEELPYGLYNGHYTWWVGGYINPDLQTWSQPGVFTVAVTPPTQPTAITVTANQGRPTIQWQPGERAAWYQLYIGDAERTHLAWINAKEACVDELCTVDPAIDWPGGTYQVWMQAWGASGFSSVTGTNSVDSWVYGGDLTLSTTAPQLPATVTVDDATSADPTFTWIAGTGSTWFEIVLAPIDHAWTYTMGWHQAADLGCAEPGQTCTLSDSALHHAALDLDPTSNERYVIYVRAWGPGGFSMGGESGYANGTFDYVVTD